MSASTDPRLLTAEELAERWQVSKAQIYRLAREGRIPVVMIGRYQRFRVAAVEAWERDREAQALR
ncbi:helix-turn-helix domain-containing protein [Conexibacter sp. S30A1]|uniref:helix-turn-helix domain-containing protein n=1 Tax=Conexibacter sp. S30A1 TaxID=2937800 RepID=UPI00200BAA54|nr:helix-turn-helix domain-containing protein [Conexibacter sp. S30A1]